MATTPQYDPEVAREVVAKAWRHAEVRKRSHEAAERVAGSFREFVPLAWEVVEPSKKFIPNCWHIDAICDHMQAIADGHIRNLIINVPPGSAKSNVVSVMFPAWKWIKDPGWRSTFASYESGLATRDSVRCRDLMRSVWYRETFAPQWSFAADQDEKTYFVNTAKGFRVATSVGGRGTGWRSNFIGVDDPLSTDASDNDFEVCIKWWENVMYNRLIDMQVDARCIIMQRVGDRDLTGHLLRQGGCEHLMIPMEYDPARSKVTTLAPGKEWRDPRTKAGELMFEALFTRDMVERDLKPKPIWAGQYQQQPNVDGGGILKSHCWRYWQPAGANLPPVRVKMPDGSIEDRAAIPLPAHFDIQIQSWDCAFTDTDRSDFVCGQVHGVRGAQRFILDQDMRRMGVNETMTAIRVMSGRWPETHLKLVERAANGFAVVEMLEKEISGLVAEPPVKGKTARAAAASPELEAGNWFLPHPMLAPWVGNPANPTEGGFLASTVLFPFGAHDDDIDSWSMGALRIQKERIGGEFGVSESDIRVEPFEIGPKWPRLYGLAIDWREIGAVWLARRPETDQHYLYLEYFAPAADPSQPVAFIRKAGDWIQGAIHPVEPGRDEQAGYALINQYTKRGLHLFSVADNIAAEVTDLQEGLRSGKLKVVGNLGRFFEQFILYRRDAKNKLPQHNTALIRAMMVAWAARDKMRGPFEPAKPKTRMFNDGQPGNTWMRA